MKESFFEFKTQIEESGKYYAIISEARVVSSGEQLFVKMQMRDAQFHEYDDLIHFFNVRASQKSLEKDFVNAIGDFSSPKQLIGKTVGVEIEVNYSKDGKMYVNPKTFFSHVLKKKIKGKVSKFLEDDVAEDEEEITEDDFDEEESSEDEEYVDESDDEEDYDEESDEESEDEEWVEEE